MSWIRENAFQIVVLGLFIWVHFKMHGKHGHGMHGTQGHGHATGAAPTPPIPPPAERRLSDD
jgi:hypothetical protein